MKKIILIISAITLILCCCISVNAAEILYSGTCGTDVAWELDGDGLLTISGTGSMNYRPWSTYADMIKSCVIESGVTSILSYAFRDCINLESISIPGSMTAINFNAFYGCDNLKKVYATNFTDWNNISFSSNPLSNGAELYFDNVLLTEITIPNINQKVNVGVFNGCSSLKKVIISEGITTIGENAFNNCANLETVIIPKSVTSVNSQGFSGCKNLKEVYADSVESWCGISFSTNAGVITNPLFFGADLYFDGVLATDIVIPETVSVIRGYAFYGCGSIQSITISGNVALSPYALTTNSYNALKNVVFLEGITNITESSFYSSQIESLTLPSGIISVGDNAFYNCTKLNAVYVQSIEDWCGIVFRSKTSNPIYLGAQLYIDNALATSIDIPDTVAKVSDYAFYGCDFLKEAVIAAPIGKQTFYECKNLKLVTFLEGVDHIDEYAFYGCSSLENIRIYANGFSVADQAFTSCKAVKNVYVPDIETWCSISFTSGTANPMNYIGASLYINNALATNIHIPKSVGKLNKFAFYKCTSLQNITIAAPIDTMAFYDCNNLESVTILDGVTSIGEDAFSCSEKLTYIYIEGKGASIEYRAFGFFLEDCSIHVPDIETWCSLKYASGGANPLYEGASLYINNVLAENIHIPYTVPVIYDYSFYSCKSLKTLSIDAADTIGEFAFRSCANLEKIYLYKTVKISSYSFANCSSLTYISLPSTLKSIDNGAFMSCNNIQYIDYYGRETEWKNISGSDAAVFANAIINYIILSEDIVLDKTNISIELGDNVTLLATVMPEDTTNKNIIWQTADASIATVADGVVSAVSVGETKITARTNNGIMAECIVRVTPQKTKITDFTVSAEGIVSLTIVNYPTETCSIYVAAYYENGVFSKLIPITADEHGYASKTIDLLGETVFKVFVWDSLMGMRPLCESFETSL